ncbi:sensor histidine kinase [Ferrimonas lipolytica]|uniref:histidine kinase n=1 Tax=Ferrimonas lipolytica TaxID=2724191 RepID=A0A6H1UD65_9GAMM|nr:HAMP domain-containing sensor histidine kinase [Ferrimonas lipolytica]QIZ77025.1 HAMP domain-containing histidine kinase [Ferrimonas lipolytica]
MTNSSVNSLFSRLSLALLSAFIVMAALLLWFSKQLEQDYQAEVTQRLHRNLAEHIVHEGPLFVDGKPDPAAVEHAFHNMMILGKGFEFYLLSPNGKLLNFSAPAGKIVRQRIDLTAINHFLQQQTALPLRGPDPRGHDRNKIFSVAPVIIDNTLYGYLYIIINGEAYDSVAASVSSDSRFSQAALILASTLVFLLVALLALFFWLTKPLRQLNQGLATLEQQGFDAQSLRLTSGSSSEMKQINGAFNRLSERLQQQFQQVKSVDEMRRELLAHVSHDLRTPLAALQGYLETWLLQPQPEPDDRRYIEIAHANAEKIHRMIDQLIELARLESAQVPMNIETVVLAELIQDVLQKYQPAAEDKQVLLDVQPKDPSIKVAADIEKLERVFTNLIDNALRHCQAGDSISIRLMPQQDNKLAISVTDSGIGIPAADLPHIFDPHYKAANSVRGDSAHSGLGLAITQKLLALHQSTIAVSSQVQQGTEFRFALPQA